MQSIAVPTKPNALVALALAGAVLLSGCLSAAAPDDHGGHGGAPGEGEPPRADTGLLAPGASGALAFERPGVHEVHCHPHPFMRQTVEATDGPPTEVHVHVLDGDAQDEYRFEPAALAVGAGSVVTYHNHGRLAHTATVGHA